MAFEQLGYFMEYYQGGKFLGMRKVEKDREQMGYLGKRDERLTEDVKLDNGKTIKAGADVVTMLYPLCGKFTPNDSK